MEGPVKASLDELTSFKGNVKFCPFSGKKHLRLRTTFGLMTRGIKLIKFVKMNRHAAIFGLILITLAVSACSGPKLVPLNLEYPTAPVEIPRDLSAHEWAQSEWWYYTGHLKSQDGLSYGFELAFFRRRTDMDKFKGLPLKLFGRTAHMAHFSVVDENSGKYLHKGISAFRGRRAHFSTEKYDLTMGNWKAGGDEKAHHIAASTKGMAIDLMLEPSKPILKYGDGGILPRGPGLANYYVSYTRMNIAGRLVFENREMNVSGIGWFDHEYGNLGSTPGTGWDWFSVQLDNHTEYMIYAIRRPDGGIEPWSRAYRVDEDSGAESIPLSEVEIEVLGKWRSPHTKAVYPSGWRIVVPRWNLDIVIAPRVADQEFRFMGIAYWEGSCVVLGTPANGHAYVELVGYDESKILGMTKMVRK